MFLRQCLQDHETTWISFTSPQQFILLHQYGRVWFRIIMQFISTNQCILGIWKLDSWHIKNVSSIVPYTSNTFVYYYHFTTSSQSYMILFLVLALTPALPLLTASLNRLWRVQSAAQYTWRRFWRDSIFKFLEMLYRHYTVESEVKGHV